LTGRTHPGKAEDSCRIPCARCQTYFAGIPGASASLAGHEQGRASRHAGDRGSQHGSNGARMTDTLLHAQFTNDGLIIAMWKFGLDTYEMAKRLHVHESVIANRLMHIRNGRAA